VAGAVAVGAPSVARADTTVQLVVNGSGSLVHPSGTCPPTCVLFRGFGGGTIDVVPVPGPVQVLGSITGCANFVANVCTVNVPSSPDMLFCTPACFFVPVFISTNVTASFVAVPVPPPAEPGFGTNYDAELQGPATPASVHIGDLVTIGLRVVNHGPAPARDVRLTDILPPGLAYVSSTALDQGGCSAFDRLVTCNVGSIHEGDGWSATFRIVARATTAGRQTNVATISSASDIVARNDTLSSTVIVG